MVSTLNTPFRKTSWSSYPTGSVSIIFEVLTTEVCMLESIASIAFLILSPLSPMFDPTAM